MVAPLAIFGLQPVVAFHSDVVAVLVGAVLMFVAVPLLGLLIIAAMLYGVWFTRRISS